MTQRLTEHPRAREIDERANEIQRQHKGPGTLTRLEAVELAVREDAIRQATKLRKNEPDLPKALEGLARLVR
jgi:hypothetical protein